MEKRLFSPPSYIHGFCANLSCSNAEQRRSTEAEVLRQRNEAKSTAEMIQNPRQKAIKGFTLAEVLITLVIIGVIAAITISVLNSAVSRVILNNQFKKTYSTLNNVFKKTVFDYGTIPDCFYNLKSQTTSNRSECSIFIENMLAHLALAKRCDSKSYENGCVPDYNWNTSDGCAGFKGENIKSRSAYVLNDGSIIFFYLDKSFPIIGFDVNGFRKPNKPGFDVYALAFVYDQNKSAISLKGTNYDSIVQCLFVEKGGNRYLSDIMGK